MIKILKSIAVLILIVFQVVCYAAAAWFSFKSGGSAVWKIYSNWVMEVPQGDSLLEETRTAFIQYGWQDLGIVLTMAAICLSVGWIAGRFRKYLKRGHQKNI
jgi:hypothetical protein